MSEQPVLGSPEPVDANAQVADLQAQLDAALVAREAARPRRPSSA